MWKILPEEMWELMMKLAKVKNEWKLIPKWKYLSDPTYLVKCRTDFEANTKSKCLSILRQWVLKRQMLKGRNDFDAKKWDKSLGKTSAQKY